MYVIELTYLHPFEVIEPQLLAHRSFLDEQYAREILLASGPQNPRTGGIIIANSRVSREELEAILRQDPFHQHGLASYQITEFTPVKFHPALAAIL